MTKITKQKAFEIAFKGLYAQGQVSVDIGGKCQYRATNGKKCGIGFLLPDSVYVDTFEAVSASGLFRDVPAFKELFHPDVTNLFLNDLQRGLHDNFVNYVGGLDYKQWLISRAQDFASTNNLTMPKIIDLTC